MKDMIELITFEKKCKSGKCKVCTCEWNNCKKDEEGIWTDNITGIEFGIHETYENSEQGGFLSDIWQGSEKSILPEVSRLGSIITDEGSYSDFNQYKDYQNKTILLIGSGPSVELLKDEDLDGIDSIWTCNHFFNHSKIKNFKIDLVSLGNEVDLASKDLKNFRNQNPNCKFGFNMTVSREIKNLNQFLSSFNNSFFLYKTRWFGRIGEIPRMMVLAALWGAKEVRVIGMDGHSKSVLESKKSDSVFEPGKFLKLSSYDYNYQRRQFVVFIDYMFTKFPGMKISNLGSRYEENLFKFIGE